MKDFSPSVSGRFDMNSKLKGATLVGDESRSQTQIDPIRMLPDLNVVKIGGQSLMDYGRKTVYPLVDEIIKNRFKHKTLYMTGAGTRARHVYDICLDLGLPSGVLAMMGEQIANQNAMMLFCLLAKHGGVRLNKDQVDDLPQFLAENCIPLMNGMAPFHWWDPPSGKSGVPEMRTDTGVFLLAETLGAKNLIYVKDVDGMYMDNPKLKPDAKFIPRIEAQDLLDMDLPDYGIEKPVLEMMAKAKFMKEIQIINGNVKGNLSRALNGEHVGTIIYSTDQKNSTL